MPRRTGRPNRLLAHLPCQFVMPGSREAARMVDRGNTSIAAPNGSDEPAFCCPVRQIYRIESSSHTRKHRKHAMVFILLHSDKNLRYGQTAFKRFAMQGECVLTIRRGGDGVKWEIIRPGMEVFGLIPGGNIEGNGFAAFERYLDRLHLAANITAVEAQGFDWESDGAPTDEFTRLLEDSCCRLILPLGRGGLYVFTEMDQTDEPLLVWH